MEYCYGEFYWEGKGLVKCDSKKNQKQCRNCEETKKEIRELNKLRKKDA